MQHAITTIFAARVLQDFPWGSIPQLGASSILSRYLESRCLADSNNSNRFTAAIRRAAETLAIGIGMDTQHTWGKNISALCQAAAFYGSPEDIRRLLDSKEDRNYACNNSESMKDEIDVFVGAAYTGNIAKVREMLASGFDVQRGSRFIGLPLQCACSGGYKDIVTLLLEHGADINRGVPWPFSTPLHSACLGGHEDIVRLLLEPQYKLRKSNHAFRIAAIGAAQGGHLNIVMLLLERAAPNLIKRARLLYEASKYGHKDFVRKVIDNEAFSVLRLESALTRSLHEAISHGYHQVVRLLLAHGVNGENRSLWGPFYAASRRGYEQVVRVLLEHRADTEIWRRIIVPAARNGQAHIVSLLLESRADFNLEKCSDQSVRALKAATRGGYESVVGVFGNYGISLESLEETLDGSSLRLSWVSSIARDSR